jgi:opacity protein-like surface antigen
MKKLCITAAIALAAIGSAQAQERAVRAFIGAGITGGGDSLATVVFTNGSSEDVRAGALIHVYGGVEFRLAPQFTVQTSLGYHVDDTGGFSNGSLRFSRYPVELLGHFQIDNRVRLGGGARFINNAKLEGSGVLSGNRVDFDSTVGAVIEGEYLVTPSIGLKLRYVNEKYKTGGVSVDGSHGGFYFTWYI